MPFKIATVIVELWRRPLRSVDGILCQRCPPASGPNNASAFAPDTLRTVRPGRCSWMEHSKTVAAAELAVDGNLILYQQFRIIAALGGSHFNQQHRSPPNDFNLEQVLGSPRFDRVRPCLAQHTCINPATADRIKVRAGVEPASPHYKCGALPLG